VTANTVKLARLRELRSEMLRSKQLKNYFDSNPRDLALLRHDSVLHPAAVQSQLKDVPEYLGRIETTKFSAFNVSSQLCSIVI